MSFGKNISTLRKKARLSQDDVARALNMTRPAYKQLEVAEREPSVAELKNISELFGQRVEDLIGGNMSIKPELDGEPLASGLNKMKYRGLILYLAQKVGAQPNVGETVLYKLLYFTETLSLVRLNRLIAGEKFIKRQYGPVPQSFRAVTNDMLDRGELDRVRGRYFTYMQTKYLPRIASTGLTDEEREIVDKVIGALGSMTATELSDLSHEDEPWKQAKQGKCLNLSLVGKTSPEQAARMGRRTK